jgi:arginyl-tRNA synthetase
LKFPEAIEAAAAEYKPNILTLYLETLAADFHSFYEQVSIINSEPTAKQARLKLIRAVATVMETGLNLLGIEAPSKM